MSRHGCWRDRPLAHPWEPIADCACGYDERMTSSRCGGCHRSREESPRSQLVTLERLGAAARLQSDVAVSRAARDSEAFSDCGRG